MSIYLRVPGCFFFPPPWFNTLACHRSSSSSCSLFLCPFTCLTQTHSCPLIIKSGRCTSTQVFMTSFIFFWFMIYEHVQIRDYLSSYEGWFPRHTDLFSLSFFPPSDNHRRGMYLQMTMDGRVSGSDVQTPYSEYLALKYTKILSLRDSLDHCKELYFFFYFKGTFSFFPCFQVCWSWNLLKQATWSWRGRHRHCSSVWTARASWADRYSKRRRAQSKKVLIFTCHLAGTSHLLSFLQRRYVEADCAFRELLLADGYTRFLSSHHGSPLSLASKQSPGRHAVPFTRFLPLRNTLAVESASDQPPNNQRLFNVDSDDLLGMALNSMISPQFSAEKWRKLREVFI